MTKLPGKLAFKSFRPNVLCEVNWFKTSLNHKPFGVNPVESDLRSIGLICYICEPGYICVPMVPQYLHVLRNQQLFQVMRKRSYGK